MTTQYLISCNWLGIMIESFNLARSAAANTDCLCGTCEIKALINGQLSRWFPCRSMGVKSLVKRKQRELSCHSVSMFWLCPFDFCSFLWFVVCFESDFRNVFCCVNWRRRALQFWRRDVICKTFPRKRRNLWPDVAQQRRGTSRWQQGCFQPKHKGGGVNSNISGTNQEHSGASCRLAS